LQRAARCHGRGKGRESGGGLLRRPGAGECRRLLRARRGREGRGRSRVRLWTEGAALIG
jgi:hypothetical protein